MALPSVGGGYQSNDGNLSEPKISVCPEPISLSTGDFTLTAAQLTNGLILGSPGASAAAYTLPTVANLESYLGNAAKVGACFDFSIINVDGNTSGVITITTNTGWTITSQGLMTIAATAGTTQSYRARKTGSATWRLYRTA